MSPDAMESSASDSPGASAYVVTFLHCNVHVRVQPKRTRTLGISEYLARIDTGIQLVETNMNLSQTTVRKAYPYEGVCEFCGQVDELTKHDLVSASAVCRECTEDLARD